MSVNLSQELSLFELQHSEPLEELPTRSEGNGKFEKDPTGLTVGVHIQNLVKVSY